MSVSVNISVASQQQVSGEQQGHRHGHRKAAMDAAAKALGMSSDDLQSALKSGKSLKDIASTQGVDLSKVQSAMQDAIQQSQGTQQPQQPQQPQSAGSHQHHHGGMKKVVDAAAQTLGMDPKDLVQQMQSGKTIQDLASAKGIDFSKVQSAITNALGSNQQSGYSAAGAVTTSGDAGTVVNVAA
jgi:hypothetical protein